MRLASVGEGDERSGTASPGPPMSVPEAEGSADVASDSAPLRSVG